MNKQFKSCQQLQYFDRILFVDAKKNIYNEITYFSLLFGDQILCFSDLNEAKKEMDHNPDMKYLIICSSKLITQISSTVEGCINCFPKLIVFCGTLSRCDEVMKYHKDLVYGAQCIEDGVIKIIKQLEFKLNQVESKANLKIAWLIKNQPERKKISEYASYVLRRLTFQMGIQVTFVEMDQLDKYLNYSLKMEKHLKVIVVADNRSRDWQAKWQDLHQLKQNFQNVINWVFISPKKKQGIKEDNEEAINFMSSCSQVQSMEELEGAIFSLIQYDTL